MKCRQAIFYIILIFLFTGVCAIAPVSAATTQVHVVKYARDGTTMLAEQTLTYQQMRDTLPVQGDGVTHYYHQGPVFIDDPDEDTEQALRWNPDEDTNVQEKDMGAVKGTDVKDLCDLVGGMSVGDTLVLKASDGFTKEFAYSNVYSPPARQGPMVITWYCSDSTFSVCSGPYPDSGYSDGMRLVFFADDSVNPWGIHAFGNYDWHESADPKYWYYYQSGDEKYPTTTGLSVKYVSEIRIISTTNPVPPVGAFVSDVQNGTAPLTVQFTDQSTNSPTSWAWDFNNDGTVDSTAQSPSHIYVTAGTYTVSLNVTNAAGSDVEVKTDFINVTESSSSDRPTLILPSGAQPSGFQSNMTIKLMHITNATGLWFNITYDPDIVHITDIRLNSTIGGSNLYTNISNSAGQASIGITSLDNITFTDATSIVDLTIMTIGAKGSSTALSTSNAEWTNSTWGSNDLIVIPGSINITMRGDFNQNGRVDIGDVTKVAYMAADLVPKDPFADFNGDTVINVADASKIAYHYVGKIAVL